ncbi:MAG: hypothetical protein NT033_00130, partial [Candidatus Omnitrophica bacterium]|nr:hypothetical protein [Candidatus Omnitrophota bacterium]
RSRKLDPMGLWLHGTDENGFIGINVNHSLRPGSSVTSPFLRDPVSGSLAFKLNPQQYANYTGMHLPKGEYLALAVGVADYIGPAKGGWAPEYLIEKNRAIAYKNPNL